MATEPTAEPQVAAEHARAPSAEPARESAPGRSSQQPAQGSVAGYAQALRVGRAELARLRTSLPSIVEASQRGSELPATTVLAARLSLRKIDDALAMTSHETDALAGEHAALAAGRDELPADGLAVIAPDRERTPGVIAAEGVAGAGSPLPFRDRIQAAFGRHDVSGIRTRTGGDATTAARALGARAYAYGDRVAFGDAPDLHTAAHEAAHVVQQRAGVALAGGAGAAGDVYEVHADEVADAVVAGHSAEAILDRMAGAGGGGATHAAVQRKDTASQTKPDPGINAMVYAHLHAEEILGEIWKVLWGSGLPRPHARLQYRKDAPRPAVTDLFNQIREYVHTDKYAAWARHLYELMPGVHVGKIIDDGRLLPDHTADAYHKRDPGPPKPLTQQEVIDRELKWIKSLSQPLDFTRPDIPGNMLQDDVGPLGSRQWYPQVGQAIAAALYDKIIESLARMGPRYLAAADLVAKYGTKTPDVSVASPLPLDELVLEMLTLQQPALTPAGGKEDNAEGKRALGKDRIVEFRRLRDPKLRQWIVVTSPSDPTLDDVIYTLRAKGGYDEWDLNAETIEKMRVRASPPYFWVLKFEATKANEAISNKDAVDSATDLADSAIADTVARDQATAIGVPAKSAGKTADLDAIVALEHVQTQLGYFKTHLTPWGAAGTQLDGAIGFAARRAAEYAKDSIAINEWATTIKAQELNLRLVGTQITAIVGQLEASKTTARDPEQLPELMPVIEVLAAYAAAAGVAHLPTTFPTLLTEARHKQQRMPIVLAELKLQAANRALGDQVALQNDLGDQADWSGKIDAKTNLEKMKDVSARMAKIRTRAASTGKLDQTELDLVATEADGVAMRARLTRISLMLADCERRSGKLDEEPSQSDPHPVRKSNKEIKRIIDRSNESLNDLTLTELGKPAEVRLAAMQKKVDDAAKGLKALDDVVNLQKHIEYVNERIADAALRELILHAVLEIALLLATGQLVGAGMSLLRGLAMARRVAVAAELIGEARTAQAVFAAGEFVFQAGAATVVQGGLNGKITRESFYENLLGNALASVAMRPFQKLLGEGAQVEAEIKTWASRARAAGKFVARGAVEVGVNIATSKAAHAIVTDDGFTGVDGQELATQAVTFLAGRAVHKRAEAMNARIEHAAEIYGTWHFAELRMKTRAMLKEAAGLGDHARPDVTARLMEKQHELLIAERDALAAAAKDDPSVDRDANRAELAALGPAAADIPLQLAQVERVGGTDAFSGTRQQIENAIANAKASGIPLETINGKPDASGVWRLRSGDRVIEVHERSLRPGEKPAAPVAHEASAKPAPIVDGHVKVDATNVGTLAKELQVPTVRISEHLTDGVEIHYEKVKTALGHDIRVVEIVVGKGATVADVRAHSPTLKRLSQYNGMLGQLRLMWKRFWGKPAAKNPFPPGSGGWEAVEELHKLDRLIDARGNWDPAQVDFATVTKELEFLTERRDHYADVIQGAIDTGILPDATGKISKPDIHAVTIVAEVKYKYPKLDRKKYYYRKRKGSETEFEPVAMPGTDATPKKVVWENGKRVLVKNEGREPRLISTRTTEARVIELLTVEEPSFTAFAEVAKELGVVDGKGAAAQNKAIEAAVTAEYKKAKARARDKGDDVVDFDDLRGAVKDHFREELKTALGKVSYARRGELLEHLSVGDRGNLNEAWYQGSYAPDAVPHKAVEVARRDKAGADGAATRESRSIDLYDPKRKEAIEVKDVKGKIDTDQYDAYVANIRNRKHVDGKPVERLKYVFTEPEGAMANLKFFIDQFGKESMAGKLTVEVFDSGRKPQRLVIEGKNAVADATAELARLQAKFKKSKP